MANSGAAAAAAPFTAGGGSTATGRRSALSAASWVATEFGQLLDQRGHFLDFCGERLRGRQGAVDHGVDFALHGVKPAAEFGQLAGEIAGAARQIGELIARFQAIMLARGDGVIDRERGERAERYQRQFGAGKAEIADRPQCRPSRR